MKIKMNSSKKTIIYVIIYFLIIQMSLGYTIPTKLVYDNRMNYEVIKDRTTNIEVAFKKVKEIIKNENLKDYVVILGDSVNYGGPVPSDASLAYYLNKKAEKSDKKFRVFNLSLPAMQSGDIYTVLLKMKEYGISNQHVIINVIYAGFAKKTPDPMEAVYWLKPQLLDFGFRSWYEKEITSMDKIKQKMYENITILEYKDYIQKYIVQKIKDIRNPNKLQEVKPWYEKPFLHDIMEEPDYKKWYSDKPFKMDTSNPQIYFLEKIINLQEGTDTLIYLSPVNDLLLKNYVQKQGYEDNLKTIDTYFKDKPIKYLNYTGKIDYNLFSDHIHLIPEGYEYLADLLWNEIIKWGI